MENNDFEVEVPLDMSPENQAKFEAKQKELWLQMLMQLMESERFVSFIENNYTIQDAIDHEAKTITRQVIENPTVVGSKLRPSQLKEIYLACSASGVVDTAKLVTKLLTILGQEEPSIILPGTSNIDRSRLD